MKIYSYLIVFGLCIACANDPDPAADQSEFVKIYDNIQFSNSYFPIDIRQTPDGGYVILGGRRLQTSNFSGVYLMKVDKFGKYISDDEVSDNLVSPVGRLLESGGKYYFFCMTNVGLQTQLCELDDTGKLTRTIAVGGSYPTVAAPDNNNFTLLSYDILSKNSVISSVTPGGSVVKSIGYSIGAGDAVEEPIVNHFLRTGRQLPFQVGKTASGQYYFNGFYNYTLSLVFTDMTKGTPMGVAQGQQDNGGFSQLYPLENNSFAAARFNFGDNYLLPKVTVNPSGISSVTDLGGNKLPELTNNAPVQITKATISGREILVYASNTVSRQIALFFYDKSSGAFVGSHYLGFSNPFEVANMIVTSDKGLAVCGTTYVAGRFPRICIFKISEGTLSKSLQK